MKNYWKVKSIKPCGDRSAADARCTEIKGKDLWLQIAEWPRNPVAKEFAGRRSIDIFDISNRRVKLSIQLPDAPELPISDGRNVILKMPSGECIRMQDTDAWNAAYEEAPEDIREEMNEALAVYKQFKTTFVDGWEQVKAQLDKLSPLRVLANGMEAYRSRFDSRGMGPVFI